MGGPFQEKRAIGLSGTVGERFGDDGIAITARVIAEHLALTMVKLPLEALATASSLEKPIREKSPLTMPAPSLLPATSPICPSGPPGCSS